MTESLSRGKSFKHGKTEETEEKPHSKKKKKKPEEEDDFQRDVEPVKKPKKRRQKKLEEGEDEDREWQFTFPAVDADQKLQEQFAEAVLQDFGQKPRQNSFERKASKRESQLLDIDEEMQAVWQARRRSQDLVDDDQRDPEEKKAEFERLLLERERRRKQEVVKAEEEAREREARKRIDIEKRSEDSKKLLQQRIEQEKRRKELENEKKRRQEEDQQADELLKAQLRQVWLAEQEEKNRLRKEKEAQEIREKQRIEREKLEKEQKEQALREQAKLEFERQRKLRLRVQEEERKRQHKELQEKAGKEKEERLSKVKLWREKKEQRVKEEERKKREWLEAQRRMKSMSKQRMDNMKVVEEWGKSNHTNELEGTDSDSEGQGDDKQGDEAANNSLDAKDETIRQLQQLVESLQKELHDRSVIHSGTAASMSQSHSAFGALSVVTSASVAPSVRPQSPLANSAWGVEVAELFDGIGDDDGVPVSRIEVELPEMLPLQCIAEVPVDTEPSNPRLLHLIAKLQEANTTVNPYKNIPTEELEDGVQPNPQSRNTKHFYPELLELDKDRPWGVELHYSIPRTNDAEADPILGYIIQLIKRETPNDGMGWALLRESPPNPQATNTSVAFFVASPLLTGSAGMMQLCDVLLLLFRIVDALDLVEKAVRTYVAGYDLALSHLQSLTQNFVLFETAFELLTPELSSNRRTGSLRANANFKGNTLRHALQSIGHCSDEAILVQLVNPAVEGKTVRYAIDLRPLTASHAGTRWYRCLEFNFHPGTFAWRRLQPWVALLLIFVDNSVKESKIQALHRRLLLAKYDSKSDITPYDCCYDLFNLLIRHTPLYQVFRDKCGAGRYHLRPFLSAKDECPYGRKHVVPVSHPVSSKVAEMVGHGPNRVEVPSRRRRLRKSSLTATNLALAVAQSTALSSLLANTEDAHRPLVSSTGPHWAHLPQYQYNFGT
eukprot:TRINITY_DN14594_c0_g1_i1.p1 TRINITY_DN14594_c0_g1~~TRINITY_DN14594_c0_g1_i1.p1  ORF type:complete len:951 (+),score=188.65 TRINITY_DN14594_c0_g1_i1:37-2889(+)